MKKVLITSLLLLALCFSLAACGSNEDPAAVNITTVDGKLSLLGFAEQDFLTDAQDTLEIDDDGDLILHSKSSFEAVSRAAYDACRKAADDGIVRNYASKEPMEYEFRETTLFFGYNRGDAFKFVAVSPLWSDQETGVTDYLFQWN